MKFNLDVTIEEVNEHYTHGVIHYDEVKLSCYRSTGEVQVLQNENVIWFASGQSKQLYEHLKYVFGE